MSTRIVFLFLIIGLTGCAFKAEPLPVTDFLAGPEQMVVDRKRYPFHQVWISPQYKEQRSRFNKLYIKPMNLDHLERTEDWRHINVYSEEELREKAKELDEFMHNAFKEAFSREENDRFALVEKPEEDALALEIAVVELIPTDVVRNAAGNVVGFFVMGGGLVSTGAGGVIATEGRMTDAMSNQLLAKFKDRESAKIRPIDLEGLSPLAFAREAIDDWAVQTVKLLNTPINAKVEDVSAISLLPW